jgi:hypothetical protein
MIMKSKIAGIHSFSARALLIAAIVSMAAAQPAPVEAPQIRIVHGSDVVEVQAVAPNIVRVYFEPGGRTTPRTLVMDPGFQPVGTNAVRLEKNGEIQSLRSAEMKVIVNDTGVFSVQVQDPAGKALVTVKNGTAQRGRGGNTVLEHDAKEFSDHPEVSWPPALKAMQAVRFFSPSDTQCWWTPMEAPSRRATSRFVLGTAPGRTPSTS